MTVRHLTPAKAALRLGALLCSLLLVACHAADEAAPPVAAPVVAASAGPVSFTGGDGSSVENAILIEGAASELVGVNAEYAWIRDHVPGLAVGRQSLLSVGGRYYDRLDGVMPDGQRRAVFFDITEFFGKLQ